MSASRPTAACCARSTRTRCRPCWTGSRRAATEALAVCLLFSFVNPAHEQRIAAMARARGVAVSASCEVLPEHREFERMSTTVANAYVAPAMERYLSRLEAGLRTGRGRDAAAGDALERGRHERGRGVAGRRADGALGAGGRGGGGRGRRRRQPGIERLISFDMGGTSTDVSLLPGRVLERTDFAVGGLPIRTPAVDVHTVGAGGGSIASLDAGGALRVGPQSAGAEPGPAAYGRGDAPTLTDAHVVLGRLRPDRFLGGAMTLDAAAAERAVATLSAGFGGIGAAHGAGDRRGGEREHGAGPARDLGGARLRPSGLRAGGVRRGGAAARLRPGGGAGHPAGADPAGAGRAVGGGDAAGAGREGRRAGAGAAHRAPGRRGARPRWRRPSSVWRRRRGRRCEPTDTGAAGSSGRRTYATRGSRTRSRRRCARRRAPRSARRWPRPTCRASATPTGGDRWRWSWRA